MNLASHTAFGETRLVPVKVYLNGDGIMSSDWDDVLLIEDDSDWGMLQSLAWRDKKIRVIDQLSWKMAPIIPPGPDGEMRIMPSSMDVA